MERIFNTMREASHAGIFRGVVFPPFPKEERRKGGNMASAREAN